jgi:hypothetical protein
MLAAVDRTSVQSLQRRFFVPKPGFSDKEVSFFMNVDFACQCCFHIPAIASFCASNLACARRDHLSASASQMSLLTGSSFARRRQSAARALHSRRLAMLVTLPAKGKQEPRSARDLRPLSFLSVGSAGAARRSQPR